MSDTAQSRRAQFLTNAQRVIATLGDPIPDCTPDLREAADRALDGEIYRSPDGQSARIDFDHVDWTCADTVNPETAQMCLLRFAVLRPLAAAFRHSKDERYAQAARRYIAAFLRDFPTRDDWRPEPYDGPTQYDLRVGATENPGWMGSLHVFLASRAFDDAFFDAVIAAARAHLNHLVGHVYPDRNIRLMNGDVLVVNSIRLSFLPEATRWCTAGVRIVNDAARRQFLSDGAHMEATPGYHDGVMHLMTSQWRLARAMPELGLVVPTERIAGMYDYSTAATRPDGATISMHDTGYSAARLSSPGAVGAHREQVRREAGLPLGLPPRVQHFPAAGQVFLRSSWSADATYITFDATTRRSFHWHPSRNTITLFANGRALLVDTGYPFARPEFPRYGHRTEHHSTINLNGWNQSHTDTRLMVRQAPGYDLVAGHYSGGYWPQDGHFHGPGMFAEHHRTLLWIHDRCLVVIDNTRCTSELWRKPMVECNWQFSEGPMELDAQRCRAVTRHPDSNLLMLFALTPERTTITKHEGERQPMRGWVPVEWGRRCIPAPLVRVATPSHDPWQADHVTVLVPFTGAEPPKVDAIASAGDQAFGDRAAGKLELRWGDGTIDRLAWIRRIENAIDRQHGFDTDAALVHTRWSPRNELIGGLTVDGHYLTCEQLGPSDQIGKVSRC